MLIDCDGCAMRDLACDTCVVSVILGAPPGGVEVDESERRALAVLAAEGLVPSLRLVPLGDPGSTGPRPVGTGLVPGPATLPGLGRAAGS